jgi:molybdopterin-guanine dinucleotide biosynthesis protein
MIERIVGLCGHKGSGKDTIFILMKKNAQGRTVTRRAFADPLKEEVAELLADGLNELLSAEMNVPKTEWSLAARVDYIERHKEKFRPFLQWYGTEYKRGMFCECYWIDAMRRALKEQNAATDDKELVVITDARFVNECTMLRDLVFDELGTEGHKPVVDLYKIELAGYEYPDDHSSETDFMRLQADNFKNHFAAAFGDFDALKSVALTILADG